MLITDNKLQIPEISSSHWTELNIDIKHYFTYCLMEKQHIGLDPKVVTFRITMFLVDKAFLCWSS